MHSTNHFNFRNILKQREDTVVSEFMSSMMTTRTEMDSNTLYIQQKAAAREVPVQIIVQRVDDFTWNVENHAAQLTILTNTFDEYRQDLGSVQYNIIVEGVKQQEMTKEVIDLEAALRQRQLEAAQASWNNYASTV